MRVKFLIVLSALFLVWFIRYSSKLGEIQLDELNSQSLERYAQLASDESSRGPSNTIRQNLPPDTVEEWLYAIESASNPEQQGLLGAALKQFPYAPRLLIKEANFYATNNDIASAIEVLANAHQFADDELAAEIDFTILEWMKNISVDVNKNSDWSRGQYLFEHALNHFDDLKPLQLMYADLLMLTQQKNQAHQIVEELYGAYSNKTPNEIHHHELTDHRLLMRLKGFLTQAESSPAAVPLTKVGSHFLVNVGISNNANINLMLDTGATLTVISERKFTDIAPNLSYIYVEDRTFNTAGGRISAPIYEADSLQIGQFNLPNIRFAVIPLGSEAFDGLLGMNVFNQFELSINQKESFLLLKRK